MLVPSDIRALARIRLLIIPDMSVEGVFRKNGNIRRLKDLAEAIDRGEAQVEMSGEGPVQIAALLKKFLRDLPDPLLTFKLHRLFVTSQSKHRFAADFVPQAYMWRCRNHGRRKEAKDSSSHMLPAAKESQGYNGNFIFVSELGRIILTYR